ncbi:DUF4870 domain-containing protein [Akkermansiaceae bacterium]|nr:DUF4870 domain-containing protein [Akkermansiaceae bacterium]
MLPQAPPPPSARSQGDEQLWIVFCHISLLLGIGIILPLVVYLVKKDESPRITHHAREALNFHISVLIYSVVCAITCIGIPLVPFIGIAAMVLSIIAAVKASDPFPYRYPLTLRLVN